jgi:glycosyltransferase involved in cell wall biosynthesis
MTRANCIITQYPLSTSYLDRFRRTFGDAPEQIVVSNITARGYLDIIRRFRAIAAAVVYVPVVDPTGRALVPPLEILSLFCRADRRLVVGPDFSVREFGFWDGVLGAVQIAAGMLGGALTLIGDRLRLGRLLRTPRAPTSANGRSSVLYLKTNLWLGVQAGGSVAHTGGVIGGFLSRGYDVDFASAEAPVALPASPAIHVCPVRPPRTYVVPREMNHYRHNANFIREAERLATSRYGFVYQRMSLGNYAGVVLSRRMKLPLVLEYNGSEVWLARNWGTPLQFEGLAVKAEDACLGHAHLVVTVSEVLKRELIERGVDPERVVAVPNGVDPERFSPDRFSAQEIVALRRRYGIAEDAVVATFVGTFGHWHGAEVLARALRRLADASREWLVGSRLHVVFIGDGVKRPVVESILSPPALQPFRTITGLIRQEDAPIHLAASDILLSPHVPNPDGSPFFGSPTKLFEYLAAGRPVVASDLYQIGDVLRGCPRVSELPGVDFWPEADQCGILVAPEDEEELAGAIRFLVDNPGWRLEAGRHARARALERHTWDHHVGAILERFQRVAAEERGRRRPAAGPARPVRVLVNGLHSKSGGGVTYLRNVLPLLARDADVAVDLCLHDEQRDLVPAGLDRVRVHYLTFRPGFWRLLLREQIELPRLARRLGADVTFSPANYGPLFAPKPVILLRNALGVAFVERRPIKLLYWLLVYLGTALSLASCRRAVAVSNYARASASGGPLRFLKSRIDVIPHGVSSAFSPPDGQARQRDRLLAVSDIYVQKNLRNLLLAVARLKERHPGLLLQVAGTPLDDHYFRSLERIVAQHGLAKHVRFLGPLPPERLAALYRECTVFVFPSIVETFGNPLVEAMASGAPIASSDTAAMPEVVGDAALFFDPADVDDMAATLDRLLGDEDLRRRLGEKAARRVRRFSWEQTAAETLAVLKEVARAGRA